MRGESINSNFVIDCSVTMSWCFPEEHNNYAYFVLSLLEDAQAEVPLIWQLEVVNVLAVAERRNRITTKDSYHFLKNLKNLPIIIDNDYDSTNFFTLKNITEKTKLTSYDSAYIELCLRKNLYLATLDDDLKQAARVMGINILSVHSSK